MMNNLRENNCSIFSCVDPDPTKWRKVAHVEDPLWRGKYPNPFHMVFLGSIARSSTCRSCIRRLLQRHIGGRHQDLDHHQGDPGHRSDLQTPALTYDGKYVLTPFSGFSGSRAASRSSTLDRHLIGILPRQRGHHDCVIIPTKLEAHEAYALGYSVMGTL